MAGKSDHTHIVAEVLTSKLSANSHLLRQLEDFSLPFEVSESTSMLVSSGVEPIEVPSTGQFDSL